MSDNTTTQPVITLQHHEVVAKFRQWINQRPGLEASNYSTRGQLNSEYRTIAKQKDRANAALEKFFMCPFDWDVLRDVMTHAFSGRLFFDAKGELQYHCGQYWPTEYRLAAAVVLEAYVLKKWERTQPQAWTEQQREQVAHLENAIKAAGDAENVIYSDPLDLPAQCYVVGTTQYYSGEREAVVIPCVYFESQAIESYMNDRGEFDKVRTIDRRHLSQVIKGHRRLMYPGWRKFAFGIKEIL